jgi:hypothetical protein
MGINMIKKAWSIFWRMALLLLVISIPLTMLLQRVINIETPLLVVFRPVIMFFIMAIILNALKRNRFSKLGNWIWQYSEIKIKESNLIFDSYFKLYFSLAIINIFIVRALSLEMRDLGVYKLEVLIIFLFPIWIDFSTNIKRAFFIEK